MTASSSSTAASRRLRCRRSARPTKCGVTGVIGVKGMYGVYGTNAPVRGVAAVLKASRRGDRNVTRVGDAVNAASPALCAVEVAVGEVDAEVLLVIRRKGSGFGLSEVRAGGGEGGLKGRAPVVWRCGAGSGAGRGESKECGGSSS